MICQRLLHFICTKNKSTYQTPDSSCATSSEGFLVIHAETGDDVRASK